MSAASPFSPPSRLEKASWCLFDFANSSFTTVITTVVYATYFSAVVAKGAPAGLSGDMWWAVSQAAAQLFVIVTAPILGAMADQAARKKVYLFRSYVVCVLATGLLSLTGEGDLALGALLVIIATTAFSTGENLIAGFLPELASPEEMGRMSAYGWTVGYFGGLLSLVLAIPFATESHARFTCLVTAVFFAAAALPTFLFLKERALPRTPDGRNRILKIAFGALHATWKERHTYRDFFSFLSSILVFQAGIAIVIAFAAIYAETVIGMTKDGVIRLFIALQLAAAAGAFGFGFLQDRFGSKLALVLSLFVWFLAVALAHASRSEGSFIIAGVLAGIGMGSSQSASRAVVGLFCPKGREAEWFGLWGLATKAASVLGMGVFITARPFFPLRESILAAGALFALGLFLLLFVDIRRGQAASISVRTVESA